MSKSVSFIELLCYIMLFHQLHLLQCPSVVHHSEIIFLLDTCIASFWKIHWRSLNMVAKSCTGLVRS